MEFDEMKKIWDAQNQEHLYVINEKALHKRVLSKKRKATHVMNTSEWMLILVNLIAGVLILFVNATKTTPSIFMYILVAWMLGVAFFMLWTRMRRLRNDQQFDRTIYGDLNYAVSIAAYQVRLSQMGRWNIIPIGLLCILGVLESGKSIWIALIVVLFFVLVGYASQWEHNFYKSRRRELESIRDKLKEQ